MKLILKKILKTLLVFILATIIVYLVSTITAFCSWCNENQVFIDPNRNIRAYDSVKIQELGDSVAQFKELMEDSFNETYEEGSGSIAELYDPLGYSILSNVHMEIREVLIRYIIISILLGVAICIAYVVITSKKMNNILKIAIGYIGVMLIIPPIYVYSFTYRFWDIYTTYRGTPIYFYIIYTSIFLLIYVINYRVGIKMSRELNQTIKKK